MANQITWTKRNEYDTTDKTGRVVVNMYGDKGIALRRATDKEYIFYDLDEHEPYYYIEYTNSRTNKKYHRYGTILG